MWYNLCARFLGISNVTYIFIFFKVIVVFSQNKYSLYVHFMYMISQVILLAFMCFLNFWDRPIFKEVMNNYVMQSQSFCEDTYVTPKGVWSWDWREHSGNLFFPCQTTGHHPPVALFPLNGSTNWFSYWTTVICINSVHDLIYPINRILG